MKIDVSMLFVTLLQNHEAEIAAMLPMSDRSLFMDRVNQIKSYNSAYQEIKRHNYFENSVVLDSIFKTKMMMKTTLGNMCNIYFDILMQYFKTVKLPLLQKKLPMGHTITIINENMPDTLLIEPDLNSIQLDEFLNFV